MHFRKFFIFIICSLGFALNLDLSSGLIMDYYLVEESYISGSNENINKLTDLLPAISIKAELSFERFWLSSHFQGGTNKDTQFLQSTSGALNAYREQPRPFTYIEANNDFAWRFNSVSPFLGLRYRTENGPLKLSMLNLRLGVANRFELYDDFRFEVDLGITPILYGRFKEEDYQLTSSHTFFLRSLINYRLQNNLRLYVQYSYSMLNLLSENDIENWRTRIEDTGLSFGLIYNL